MIRYIAVGIDETTLDGVSQLRTLCPRIICYTLWGDFDQAFDFLRIWDYGAAVVWVCSFGSTLSNEAEDVVIERFEKWSSLGDLWIGQDDKHVQDMAKKAGCNATAHSGSGGSRE